jgi:aldehyde dehydrogenase (NAD+)
MNTNIAPPTYTGQPPFQIDLSQLRHYYDSGATRSYAFRKQQLLALKQGVMKYEKEINDALYTDLKKSPEETYATETGLLIAEINTALKNLRRWMRPRRMSTNLANLPSSSTIYRDPLGVVLIISAWNYPFQLSLIPLVGAIGGGNCAIIKPSELAPATQAIIEKLIAAIYPPEYISVITGDGAIIVPAMIRSFRFDHIFYTGSIPVGKLIYQQAAAALIPVTLELGGKSPAVVESDASLAIAARRIALGKFANVGQTCVAPDYVLVHASIKDLFIEKMKHTISSFFGEDASLSGSYGKIINEKRFDKLLGYLSQGRILFGGQYNKSTLFIAPTIMEDIPLDAPLFTEEIFGPILPVYSFASMQEALAIIQHNPSPLSFYVFTASAKKEKDWIEAVPFGSGCINNTAWQFINHHLPFGGIGYSGTGAYHGQYSFKTFTHAKPVMKTPVWPDPSIKYPPFKGKLKWFKRLIR